MTVGSGRVEFIDFPEGIILLFQAELGINREGDNASRRGGCVDYISSGNGHDEVRKRPDQDRLPPCSGGTLILVVHFKPAKLRDNSGHGPATGGKTGPSLK
jgi:hypothetical protein